MTLHNPYVSPVLDRSESLKGIPHSLSSGFAVKTERQPGLLHRLALLLLGTWGAVLHAPLLGPAKQRPPSVRPEAYACRLLNSNPHTVTTFLGHTERKAQTLMSSRDPQKQRLAQMTNMKLMPSNDESE